MKNEIIIYHGSENIIEKPEYGKRKPYNDYGLGFYCTEYKELAKEWACSEIHNGYSNSYLLDLTDLKILDLNSKEYCLLHWISVLLENRKFTLDNDFGIAAKEYILKNFKVNIEGYDIIIGYRADDSNFSFANDFLQNRISVRRLSQVMKLGNLGNQIVLITKKAFSKIKYLGYEEVLNTIYYPLKKKRDELARLSYLSNKKGESFVSDDIYMIDIMRGGSKTVYLKL